MRQYSVMISNAFQGSTSDLFYLVTLRLEVYTGAEYAWNNLILVEGLQSQTQNVRPKTLVCA